MSTTMSEEELTAVFKETIAQLRKAKFEHLATKKERDDIRKEKAENDGTLSLKKQRHYSALTRKFNREINKLQALKKQYHEQKNALLNLGAKEEELPTEDDIGTGSDEEETEDEKGDETTMSKEEEEELRAEINEIKARIKDKRRQRRDHRQVWEKILKDCGGKESDVPPEKKEEYELQHGEHRTLNHQINYLNEQLKDLVAKLPHDEDIGPDSDSETEQ